MTRTDRKAVFLDRDGTLILDVGYPSRPQHVRLLPGVAEALARLREQGFALILVSNQSGIGRGLLSREQAETVHQQVVSDLAQCGVQLDAAYYCPHAPEERCACRKPSPEMLRRAAEDLGLCLDRSFLVGDKPSDIEAGRRAGCRTILIGATAAFRETGPLPDAVAADWPEVLSHILSQKQVAT